MGSTKAEGACGIGWAKGEAGREPWPSPIGSTGGGANDCGGNGEREPDGSMGSLGMRIGAPSMLAGCVITPIGVVTVMAPTFRGSLERSMRYPGGRNVLKPCMRSGLP